jgi:outer membrane protein assembly factor BamB
MPRKRSRRLINSFTSKAEYILDLQIMNTSGNRNDYSLFYCGYYEIGLLKIFSAKCDLTSLWSEKTERTATVTSCGNDIFLTNQKGLIKRLRISHDKYSTIWEQEIDLLPMKIFAYKRKLWIFGQEGILVVLKTSDGSRVSEHSISKYPISNVAGSFYNIWIFTNNRGDIFAFNPKSRSQVWNQKTSNKSPISGLSFFNRTLFVINQRGEIWQISPRSGEIINQHHTAIPAGSNITKIR